MMVRVFAAFIALFFLTQSASAEKRVALVVGVGAYTIQNTLESSRKDSELVGSFLRQKGFQLVGGRPLVDLNKAQYDQAIEMFGEMAQGADVAVFYYSGHGMQIGGTNYLFPVDSPYVSPNNIAFRFINMNTVMGVLERSRAKLKMVLLDACRNNPFVKDGSKADVGGGLATMNAPSGTIIGFATQPGNTASDGGVGNNSPYTAAVFDVARKPGYNQFRVFNDAALIVMSRSGGKQQPWMSASPITYDFYFTPPVTTDVSSAPVTNSMAMVMPAPAPLPAVVSNASINSNTSLGNVSLNYTQEANKLFQQYNYAAGRAVLTQGISEGQRTAIMYSYRGFSWLQDGLNNSNPHETLALFRAGFPDFDEAIKLEETYPNSYRHRGNMIQWTWKALKKTNQPTNNILDNAIKDLQNAVKLDPTSMTSAYFLGEAYNLRGKLGDYDQAIFWFNKALELNPKFVAPHSGLCYAYRMKGDMASASREASIALSRDSDQSKGSCLTETAWNRYVPKF